MFINKSNNLIQNISFDLTALELKVLSKIISLVDSKAKEFKRYYDFEIKDFGEELKNHYYEENKNDKHHYDTNYSKIKKAVENLSDKGFRIIKNNGDTEIYTRWISSVITEKYTGKVRVELPSEMKSYYLDLSGNYTSYQAKYIYKLRSKYSIRIYELLQTNKNKIVKKGQKLEVKYTLKELRKILDLDKDTYKRYNNFRTNVLEVAKKELKKKEIDFQFDYYTIGRGELKSIFLVIKNVKKQKEKEEAKKKQEKINNSDSFDQINYQESQDYLKSIGMSEKEINKIISNYDEMRIRRNINYTINFKQTHKFEKSELAFFRYAIKKDIAMVNHQEKQEYKENKEKEKEKKNFDKPLPMEIDPEVKEEKDELSKQKEKLKTEMTLWFEFLAFLSKKAENKPGGYIASVLPKLQVDKELIDTEGKLERFINMFFVNILNK